LAKDFVADFLMTAAAVISTLPVAWSFGLPTDAAGYYTVAAAIFGAFIRAGYRAALRWALTP
jgi:hypothetical protein